MKMLIAVDPNPYSDYAMDEATALAANTWAMVNLMVVQPKTGYLHLNPEADGDKELQAALVRYQGRFFDAFDKEDCPYIMGDGNDVQHAVQAGGAIGMAPVARKRIFSRTIAGNPVKAVLGQADEDQSDLIVLACDQEKGCSWSGHLTAPARIVNEASCSVLVVKNERKIKNIVCCMDQNTVTQSSLELINQLVTIHGAGLTLVGFSNGSGELKTDVEQRMHDILRYYQKLRIHPIVEIVDIASLDAFVHQEKQWGLMALWMGKQSLLGKWFPRSKMNKLIKESRSSVLILR